ncbi:AMP-binding protein [Effusibacillus pohliae]|uniref:AMP-binding protein n=1 Tax=Effusibacillus pohliae TaxID=232270 RepID=UPI000376AC5F|nr:AMP-binding protein [Effusibacillus pohliae]
MGLTLNGKAHWLPEVDSFPLKDWTVGKLLQQQAARFPNHIAVLYMPDEMLGIGALRWTYKEYEEKAKDVAKALLAAGYRKGDHMAVWAINVPDWLLLEMGAAKIGAVLVTMNPALREEDASYVLKSSDAKAVFVMSSFRGRSYVEEVYRIQASGQVPELKQIITFDATNECLNFSDLVETGKRKISDEILNDHEKKVQTHDVFQIQFTSGTTGFPKGAMLTHHNAVNNAELTFRRWEIGERDRVLSPLPLFHTAGSIMLALGTLAVGATYIPMPFFDPKVCVQTLKELGITHFAGVPTMLQAVLHQMETNGEYIPLRLVMSGGSPVPPILLEKIEKKLKAKTVVLMGMTETSPTFSATTPTDPQRKRWETCGRPLPHTELRIVDPQTRKVMNCGIPGEIEVRGYMVMKGYYKMEKQTAETLSADGWLKTGDVGVLDNEGYLNVVGRIKEMIIRGGENIYPKEVENFLISHPLIDDAQVVGIPDDYYGEVPVAFIKKRLGVELTEKEVKDFCKGRLSHQKIPAHIRFVEEYPLTASGKVQKHVLREMIMTEMEKKG